jgi:hypothetical protein
MSTTEKIGVLLVHGIGEQRRFEHLKHEARNIARVIRAKLAAKERLDKGKPKNSTIENSSVRVVVRTSVNAQEDANQEIWQAEDAAPVFIEIQECQNESDGTCNWRHKKVVELHFDEVWWADLDEPTTPFTALSFWLWGLSLWTNRGYQDIKEKKLPLHHQKTRPPAQKKLSPLGRIYLFLIAFVIFLVLPVLFLLDKVLGFLGLRIKLDIISQFIGDVKLYQQEQRVHKNGTIEDLDQRPRVTIRRRMVSALVRMAQRKYDRWYVFAHSQGTVVAYNGLTEIEQALPNYLSCELWHEIKSTNLAGTSTVPAPANPNQMRPSRPHWLNPADTIKRKELFANLRGFMTYGSPLDKFALLWPVIVPQNVDEKVFQDFEWINIYDPTDPVADNLKYFQPQAKTTSDHDAKLTYLKPRNIGYKTEWFHLLSHINYLTFNCLRTKPLADHVSDWVLHNRTFPRPDRNSCRWPSNDGQETWRTLVYRFLSTLVWPIAGFVIAVVASKLVLLLSWAIALFITLPPLLAVVVTYLTEPVFYLYSAFVTVVVVGAIGYVLNYQPSSADQEE